MIKILAPKKGVKKASLNDPKCAILDQYKLEKNAEFFQVKSCKYVESLGMVPRDGIEPSRPMLSYPRILSPDVFLCQSVDNIIVSQIDFKKKASLGRHLVTNDNPSCANFTILHTFSFHQLLPHGGAVNYGITTS